MALRPKPSVAVLVGYCDASFVLEFFIKGYFSAASNTVGNGEFRLIFPSFTVTVCPE
jgi:hypothetical protein